MNRHVEDAARAVLLAIGLLLLVVLASLLAGCAELPRKPVAVQVRTVEVPRIVPVPCVAAADIPPRTPTAMPDARADAARKAAGAYVDMRNLVRENDELRALLTACTQGAIP